MKKEGDQFDVSMGSYDGAEICELIGLYMLDRLNQHFDKEYIGLYRDDGLSAFNFSGPQADRARKKIIQTFQECDLRVTVDILLKRIDFLDVTLDLVTGRYWPYRKPNSELLYINAQSNHPPNIIKQLPIAIVNRISSLSCNTEEFHKAMPAYKEALEKSGHHPTIQPATPATRAKRQRRRNVIWFNPPYNQNVTTNVAGRFLKLVSKHFPKHHRLHKLFNRNNVKCSYSCMPNMGSIITAHNAKVLSTRANTTPRTCNCRRPAECPLNGKCLTQCIVYKATITATDRPTKTYFGLTEDTSKTRYSNHTVSFRHEARSTDTELSKYIWELRRQGLEGKIHWEIAHRAVPYKCGSRKCDLCLSEKLAIAKADPNSTLNKRSEIISKCRHRKKYACIIT